MKTNQPVLGRMRRSLSRLASGAILSQGVLIASTPLLTRVFDAQAFGLLAAFSATYAIAVPLTTLKFDAALILPKAVSSARKTTALVVLTATVVCLLTAALIVLAMQTSVQGTPTYNLWLPVVMWLGAIYTLAQQWCARNGDYSSYAVSQVVGSTLNVGTSLGLGYVLGPRPGWLVLGFVSGMAGSVLYMLLVRGKAGTIFSNFKLAGLIKRAKLYRQFPLFVLPTAVISSVGQNSLPIILSSHYSLSEVGQFAVANRLMLVPAALIGSALAEAFRSEFVRCLRERLETTHMFDATLRTLIFLALPIFGLLAIAAPVLFEFIFGSDFSASGYVARVMVVGVAAQFICSPFVGVFVALRRANLGFWVQAASAALPLILLFGASALSIPMNAALFLFAIASATCLFLVLMLARRLCRLHRDQLGGRPA